MNTSVITINDIILSASRRLAHGKPDIAGNARLEAEILCAHALATDRTALIIRGRDAIDKAADERFQVCIDRRLKHEPIAYITGVKEFFGMDFHVDGNVLIPRPETEELVELAIASIAGNERILDAGTGSGCIAVALARYCPDIHVTAIDISPGALAVAASNADRLLGMHSIQFLTADMTRYVPEERFDIVISNPPYVADGEIALLQPELAFEPRTALAGGPTGVEFIRDFADNIGRLLSPEGRFFLEVGDDAPGVVAIFKGRGYTCGTENDLSGKARFIKGQP
ncbi:MAG: peptide chain release factor N(5)-glutamine methyltransferase [Spirochaetota bacterium]